MAVVIPLSASRAISTCSSELLLIIILLLVGAEAVIASVLVPWDGVAVWVIVDRARSMLWIMVIVESGPLTQVLLIRSRDANNNTMSGFARD